MNVFTGGRPNHLHYPFFVLVLVAVATFYAFGTVGEQLSFVAAGDVASDALGSLVADVTPVLSVDLGLVALLLSRHVAGLRRSEMRTLSSLGLAPGGVFILVTCEQGLVLASALAVGLPIGVLFSHALVFVAAAILSAPVSGFGFFFSPGALRSCLLAILPVVVATLSCAATMAVREGMPEREGRPWRWLPPTRTLTVARLVVGTALVGLSTLRLGLPSALLVVRGGGQVARVTSAPPVSVLLLAFGTWEALRALGDLLARGGMPRHRGRGVMVPISHLELGRLLGEDALPLSFATTCAALAGFQLVGAFGSAGAADASLDVPLMVYLASYVSFVLYVVAGTTLAASVGMRVLSSGEEYLTLYGLGLSPEAIRHSQPWRVVWGFAVPVVLAALDVTACLVGERLGSAPPGAGWSSQGAMAAVVLGTVVLACYLGTSVVSVRNSLRQEANAHQIRW